MKCHLVYKDFIYSSTNLSNFQSENLQTKGKNRTSSHYDRTNKEKAKCKGKRKEKGGKKDVLKEPTLHLSAEKNTLYLFKRWEID